MYEPCGHNHIHLDANSDQKEFKAVLKASEKAFKALHENGEYNIQDLNDDKQYKSLINVTSKTFKDAINEGIDDNVIPEVMRSSLENDVFIFSALKTHSQLLEASKLLLDKDGKIKPFNKFSEDIKSIKANYNENYLQAEYQFAVSSAQMAANWNNIDANSDRYDLQYRTAGDENVRASHDALRDVTLPVSDPFWNSYYPPNGWRCRCNVVEVRKGKYDMSDSKDAIKKGNIATTQINKSGKNKLEIFRFNPGKDKVIFPPKHPYNKVKGAKQVKEVVQPNVPRALARFEEETGVTVNRKIFDKLKTPVQLKINKKRGSGAYFHPKENYVRVPLDDSRLKSKWNAESTVYHEYGHAIDWQYDFRKSKAVTDLMKKYRDMYSADGDKLYKELHDKLWDSGKEYWLDNKQDELNKSVATQDTLMSLNKNYGQGHSKQYYSKKWFSEAEFVAHAFENYFVGNSEFEKYMPDLYKETIKLIDDFVNE